MVEEEVVALSSPAPLDHHKRKLEDLEPEDAAPVSDGQHVDEENGVTAKEVSDASEAKRPRVDDAEQEELAGEVENENEIEKEKTVQQNNSQNGEALEEEQPLAEEASIIVNTEPSLLEDAQEVNPQPDGVQLPSTTEQSEDVLKPSEDDPLPATEIPQLGDTEQSLSESSNPTTSRRMEVPNQMVGVLIGKAGDTIRNLQFNSGAKIQITRDADAEPGATTRPVELIGTLACINKADRLIKEVIAEADAGGSPALVAKGFTLAAGVMEQIEIQVPNDKVGLVIGKGGETIKSLQTRSGARIQLVPQHLPEGDKSKERTVRVSGDKKQIDIARELIKEVMNQNVKPSTFVSNYGQQQSYRPRGPPGSVPQWGGPRAPHNAAPSTPYDYQQHRGGPYPSQNQHYPPPPPYGGYPSQGPPPRGGFNSGWEQRPPLGPPNHSGGYDYYGGQGVPPPSAPHPTTHMPSGRPSHPQANYNYGQPPPYSSQTQPGNYQDYPNQQQYPPPPSNVPYQAPVSVAPSYGQSAPAQQPYPYADGYNQQQQPGYPPQVASSQPVAGYGQPGPGYPQAYGQYPPQTQQGYSNQTPASAASYGYQGQADPSAYAAPQAYNSAPQSAAYAQPPANQAGYEQPGGYPPPAAAAVAAAPQPAGGYPQPAGGYPQQYDASQMYGASG